MPIENEALKMGLVFDRIYPTLAIAEANIGIDNLYLGRYILVDSKNPNAIAYYNDSSSDELPTITTGLQNSAGTNLIWINGGSLTDLVSLVSRQNYRQIIVKFNDNFYTCRYDNSVQGYVPQGSSETLDNEHDGEIFQKRYSNGSYSYVSVGKLGLTTVLADLYYPKTAINHFIDNNNNNGYRILDGDLQGVSIHITEDNDTITYENIHVNTDIATELYHMKRMIHSIIPNTADQRYKIGCIQDTNELTLWRKTTNDATGIVQYFQTTHNGVISNQKYKRTDICAELENIENNFENYVTSATLNQYALKSALSGYIPVSTLSSANVEYTNFRLTDNNSIQRTLNNNDWEDISILGQFQYITDNYYLKTKLNSLFGTTKTSATAAVQDYPLFNVDLDENGNPVLQYKETISATPISMTIGDMLSSLKRLGSQNAEGQTYVQGPGILINASNTIYIDQSITLTSASVFGNNSKDWVILNANVPQFKLANNTCAMITRAGDGSTTGVNTNVINELQKLYQGLNDHTYAAGDGLILNNLQFTTDDDYLKENITPTLKHISWDNQDAYSSSHYCTVNTTYTPEFHIDLYATEYGSTKTTFVIIGTVKTNSNNAESVTVNFASSALIGAMERTVGTVSSTCGSMFISFFESYQFFPFTQPINRVITENTLPYFSITGLKVSQSGAHFIAYGQYETAPLDN